MTEIINSLEAPIFETKLSFSDFLFTIIQIIFCLILIGFLMFDLNKEDWIFQLSMSGIFLFFLIQTIRPTKTFHLYNDKLTIRRPFFFTKKSDVIFNIREIKGIIFRKIKGRFGGPHIIIKAKRNDASYKIGFSTEKQNEFIKKLNELNIKVINEM